MEENKIDKTRDSQGDAPEKEFYTNLNFGYFNELDNSNLEYSLQIPPNSMKENEATWPYSDSLTQTEMCNMIPADNTTKQMNNNYSYLDSIVQTSWLPSDCENFQSSSNLTEFDNIYIQSDGSAYTENLWQNPFHANSFDGSNLNIDTTIDVNEVQIEDSGIIEYNYVDPFQIVYDTEQQIFDDFDALMGEKGSSVETPNYAFREVEPEKTKQKAHDTESENTDKKRERGTRKRKQTVESRTQNNIACKKYRQKRKEKLDALQQQVQKLEEETALLRQTLMNKRMQYEGLQSKLLRKLTKETSDN